MINSEQNDIKHNPNLSHCYFVPKRYYDSINLLFFSVVLTKESVTALWSSGQSSWLQKPRFRVRFSVVPNFLSSSGSATGFT
jgi:hypothetical protein